MCMLVYMGIYLGIDIRLLGLVICLLRFAYGLDEAVGGL
jgi:hypothetical protein